MTVEKKSPEAVAAHKKSRLVFLQIMAGLIGFAAVLAYQKMMPPREHEVLENTQQRAILEAPPSITGNYLAGRYAATVGDYAYADHYLENTLGYDPDNLEIAGYTYRMNLINGDMDGAVEMAKKLRAANDEGSNPEIMLLLSLVKEERYEEARSLLTDFEVQGFNLVVVPLISNWLDLASGTLKEPVKQHEALRKIAEFAPFIYYQTAIINDLAGFEDEALIQYNESLALSKTIPFRVVEMMANLHARRGEWAEAEALYAKYAEQNPDSKDKFSAPKSEDKEAPARLNASVQDGLAEIFFSTASILHNENLNEEALIYIQQVLYLKPDFPAAQLMRGTILEHTERFEEALVAYDSLKPETPYYNRALIRKAYVLNALERPEEGLKILNDVDKDSPRQYQAQLTRGDIHVRMKRYDAAAEAYTQALDSSTGDKANLWAVHYARGIAYERLDKWDMAEQDFRKALELQPDQPDVLNYLGYTWLTRNENLQEAKSMLQKAVVARPSDAHIIDSMGWALYLLEDYEGAVAYLERAIELMPIDPTVNDHLGDAYWRMGRKNEARFQWRRALLFDPEPEQVEALNRKLAEGLPEKGTVEAQQSAEAATVAE